MKQQQDDLFFQQITSMFQAANPPAVITDGSFSPLWASDAAVQAMPCLALPDGVQLLLNGHAPDEVKKEIAARGFFVSMNPGGMLSENAVRLSALSPGDPSRYLVQPVFTSPSGTGLHPQGANRVLSSFSSQYRLPLSNIFASLHGLMHVCASAGSDCIEASGPYFESINQNAFQLLRSCGMIFDYTCMFNAVAPLSPRPADLYQYLRELLGAVSVVLESNGIPLESDIPDGPLPASCDTNRLSIALLQILSNCSRFTREGNRVRVRVRQAGQRLLFSISDHGLGIPENILPQVFEPYFSYRHGDHPFSGNGLGLPLARLAIGMLGGAVTLSSQPGEGTTVTFTILLHDIKGTPSVECSSSEYLSNQFSTVHVAFADSVQCPLR